MKTRLLVLLVVLLTLGLTLAGATLAQAPTEPIPTRAGDVPPDPLAAPDWDDADLTAVTPPSAFDLQPSTASAPAVDLGESGLSFRYVKTFGVSEQAYIADVQHLNSPAGLFVDAANALYVVEDQGNRVLKFNAAGNNLLSIGTAGLFVRGSNTFNLPRDAAVDNSGNLWVVDRHRAVQYSATGTYLRELPQNDPWQSGNDNTHFNEPYGIAFDLAGRMFIADSRNHRVQVYTFSGGQPVYSATIGVTGVTGSDNAHFNTPYRLAVDSSGGLYVVDNRNNRVQRCVLSGAWTCTTLDGGLNNPQGIAVDGNDNVYIADTGAYRIRKCMAGGACSNLANVTNWTTDLAVDSGGTVYASTQSRHIIRKFSSAGNLIGTHLGVDGVPYLTDGYHYNHPRVAIDGDDSIIVLEENGQRLLKLSPAGALAWAVGEPGVSGSDNVHFDWPHGVAVGKDRRIYVADNCRVQIFSGDGTYMAGLGAGCGTGDYQFGWASGIAVDDNNYIYVSDANNHRVQIYDSNRVFVGRIGVTGQCGTANDRLCWPIGIEVDAAGNIYVADSGNARVQKFNSGRQWQMTIGTTGSWDDSFSQLNSSEDIAVDAQGRIYVADIWNERVQVFDATGAYLTTIGGAYGNKSSQFRNVSGVDVDRAGNVYVTDFQNSRIQKFAPGVPGWRQVNINGFGDKTSQSVDSLEVFNGQLYAGATNYESGGSVLRTANSMTWTAVTSPGFGSAYTNTNAVIFDMIEFNGHLYAGTGKWSDDGVPGQVWRSSNGTVWTQVGDDGFGNVHNVGITTFGIFSNTLYAATTNPVGGLEIWRSTTGDSGDWERAAIGGFGGGSNYRVCTGLSVFDGYLYAAVEGKPPAAARIWRTDDGVTWTQVNSDGFGDTDNYQIESVFAFDGYLYAGTDNDVTGSEIWRTADGATWSQVTPDGFGDSNNSATLWSIATAAFNNRLYIGTSNSANGGEIWMYLPNRTYLPVLLRQ